MVEEFVNRVLMQMAGQISDGELTVLKQKLYIVLTDYQLSPKTTDIQVIDETWKKYLNMFLIVKKTEGRSPITISQYEYHLRMLLQDLGKELEDITEDDLLFYLTKFQMNKGVSYRYIDNKRLIFSSFFSWLHAKGYIRRNPVMAMGKIKYEKKIKRPFSDEELELIRENCKDIRERALVDFLYSTGVRVNELTNLKISDINFRENKVIVMGKGSKEREVYLTPICVMNLRKYLKSRTDNSDALFASTKKPYTALQKASIRSIMREIGKRAGVDNVHPHRFRRTMATNLLRKGMPIEEVKAVLGHTKIDTTLIYCTIASDNVKHSHQKYMCG